MVIKQHYSCHQVTILLAPSLPCCCGIQITAEIWNLSFTDVIKLLVLSCQPPTLPELQLKPVPVGMIIAFCVLKEAHESVN
jgi:hypothetical protein